VVFFWLLKPSLDQLVDCLGCSWGGMGDEGKKSQEEDDDDDSGDKASAL
jgi:hypothetical protein